MGRFYWIGNHPGLDFLNTAIVGDDGEPLDLLERVDDVAAWALQAELVSEPVARDGAVYWRNAGDELLSWARALRDAVARQLVMSDHVDPSVAARLDRLVSAIPVTLTVIVDSSDAARTVVKAGVPVEELRLAIAQQVLEAVNLDRSRIRTCESDRCVLVYLDTSKNRSRRWCDMATCGNRAKAAAHYKRTRHLTT